MSKTNTLKREDYKKKSNNILDIGHRIKTARVDANLKQKDLARKLEISSPLLSLWEANKRRLPAQTLGNIAYILKKPIGYFYYEN